MKNSIAAMSSARVPPLTDLENVTTAMQDFAELLRTERLRRGWTLHDVSIRTHLSITVLKALEEGRSERIGAPDIVKRLLRNYSTVLEIDAKSPGQGGADDVPGTETDREPAPSGEKAGGRKSAVIAFLACCGLAFIFLGLSLSGWKGFKTGIQTQGTQPGSGEDQAVKPSRTLSEPRIEGGEQPEVPRQVQLPAKSPWLRTKVRVHCREAPLPIRTAQPIRQIPCRAPRTRRYQARARASAGPGSRLAGKSGSLCAARGRTRQDGPPSRNPGGPENLGAGGRR